MALGANLTTVQITGTYVDYEGNAIAGQVRFSISQVLRNGTDDQMVAPSVVVVSLVDGSFSVTLPATNDPDVIPNPFTYAVEESFAGGRSYTISIPYTSAGALDLADISPNPTLDTTYIQLIDQTTFDALETNINTAASYQLDLNALASFTSSAQASASTASTSATTALNNASITINPLLLIGG
jgi:hypothetical protein